MRIDDRLRNANAEQFRHSDRSLPLNASMKALKSRFCWTLIVYKDNFGSHDVLDVSGFKHRCVNHSRAFVSRSGRHINGIENFWNRAKRVL